MSWPGGVKLDPATDDIEVTYDSNADETVISIMRYFSNSDVNMISVNFVMDTDSNISVESGGLYAQDELSLNLHGELASRRPCYYHLC